MGGRGGKIHHARPIVCRRYRARRDRDRRSGPRTHHRRRADTIARLPGGARAIGRARRSMREGGGHIMEAITQAPSGALFDFLRRNDRESKPRTHGITESRGPYYTPLGKRALQDILETMGPWVDALKFAGGSFTLIPERALEELIALCHEHGVLVSTGGFIERVLTQGSDAVAQYIDTCRAIGFDIIELSSGFITIPADDWLRLIERVRSEEHTSELQSLRHLVCRL